MTEQELIDQLKAQVNCLREALLNTIMYRVGTVNYGDPMEALEATPEQCLAEAKAKAIEEALCFAEAIGSNGHDYDYDGAELQKYADKLREQAK